MESRKRGYDWPEPMGVKISRTALFWDFTLVGDMKIKWMVTSGQTLSAVKPKQAWLVLGWGTIFLHLTTVQLLHSWRVFTAFFQFQNGLGVLQYTVEKAVLLFHVAGVQFHLHYFPLWANPSIPINSESFVFLLSNNIKHSATILNEPNHHCRPPQSVACKQHFAQPQHYVACADTWN